jgi:hypothetical protein
VNILNSTTFLKNQLCNIFKWDFVAWWSPGPRDIKEAIGDMCEAVGDWEKQMEPSKKQLEISKN